MFSEIVTAIRGEIIYELKKRTQKGDCYIFRYCEDDGEEKVVCDLSVGFPDEMNYFPDVVQVWGGDHNQVFVTVRDAMGEDRDLSISDVELSVGELASILDAIVEVNVIIAE